MSKINEISRWDVSYGSKQVVCIDNGAFCFYEDVAELIKELEGQLAEAEFELKEKDKELSDLYVAVDRLEDDLDKSERVADDLYERIGNLT